MFPQARREGLTVHELPEETLVYDRQRHRAHCLNRTAALVWKECDGRTSVPQLAETLRRVVGAPVDEAVVRLALDELARAHLLEPLEDRAQEQRWSRRDLVRKLAAGALVLPAVLSITSPASAQHTSPGFGTTGGGTTGTVSAGGTTAGGTTVGGTTVGGTTVGGTTVGGTTVGGTTVGGTTVGGTTVGGTTVGGTTVGGTTVGGTTSATGVTGPTGTTVGTGGGGTGAPGAGTPGAGGGGGGTGVTAGGVTAGSTGGV